MKRTIIYKALLLLIVLQAESTAYAQESKATGLSFLEESSYRSIPLAATPSMGNIPDRVDYQNLFPKPGNQGAQGSCVGWAVAYLKTYQEAVERDWPAQNRSNYFSPSYIYNQVKLSESCESGAHIPDALNLIRIKGASLLTNFPYALEHCTAMPTAENIYSAQAFSVSDWRRVNPQDTSEMQAQIASGFPILIGMIVDDGFMKLRAGQIYQEPSGTDRGGHAMVIIGYDNDLAAYKVINSWGDEWGDSGYGWISYNALKLKIREAYVVQDIIFRDPNPIPEDIPRPTPQPELVSSICSSNSEYFKVVGSEWVEGINKFRKVNYCQEGFLYESLQATYSDNSTPFWFYIDDPVKLSE